MGRPEWARRTGTGHSESPGRRLLPIAAVMAMIALLAACSGNSGNSAVAATSPAGNQTASAPLAAARTVPMTVIRHGQATAETVPVYVNGHGPYTFLLDTGSTVSSINSKLEATLHLPKTGNKAQIKGVVTSKQVPIVTIKGWKVGQVPLTPENVAVLQSSPTSGSVMGLLGSDELGRFSSVTVDFQRHQLRLIP